ncbi:uncharacterized protein LOC105800937 [Gossypium raimondii]|uniref:uncharacterized protein LOC105800937 n=1 Tax=Gossypium raimondii TaxID=29730 RepID=UPI00227AE411|nr:uncharacterized protein LOC105800937 [Gossypium raimondii]
MTRSSSGDLEYDPEIEKSARARRKETEVLKRVKAIECGKQVEVVEPETKPLCEIKEVEDNLSEPEMMANRTIRQLAAAPNKQTPLCINYPTGETPFELKFFPASRAAELRRDIVGIRQIESESLYDYWERYKKLCASCPQHGLTEQSPLQYFYEGLLSMEMKMVDTASGGALVNMTPQRARELISTMAANSQQYRLEMKKTPLLLQKADSPPNLHFPKDRRWIDGGGEKKNRTQLCGVCTTSEHPTDLCPILNENSTAHVDAVGGFPGPPQRRYDPFSNTYNPGWKDHPNLNYGANSRYNPSYQPRPLQPPQPPPKPSISLEDIMERLAVDAPKYQQRTDTSIQELTNQVSKLSMAVNRLESQRKLPSQTEPNPRQNVSAITLRSEKVLETVPEKRHGRLVKDKKEKEEKEILETFRKVEVNIPLLDAIKQIPRYAKFLKELCTSKRRLLGNVGIKKAMCDLGASINVMPYPIYKLINAGPLKKTGVIIQLVDRSVVYPEGLLEDVLVKVNELVFPADFYIINMEDDNSTNSSDILLGRPFLSTASAKIDVRSGTLTMEFDGEIVKFNVYEAMGHPNSLSNISSIDIIDCLTQTYSEYQDFDELETILYRSIDMDVLSRLDELSIIKDLL